jgi:wyosine [tRNA(Phe)-imidazoG37] synthetase (radical SAM superfamily)
VTGKIAAGVQVPGASLVAACAAPSTSLYFRPDGYVAACCGGWHLLGRVCGDERRSIREIWEGDAAAILRDAVAVGDFGYGCWECGQHITAGRREASLAADFDRYALSSPGVPDHPSMMDFALSNRCNLQCVMCNGGLSSAIRHHREGRDPMPAAYDDRFFDELDEFLPHLVRAQFKGGEPFLARENRRIWDRFRQLGGTREVCVTTNGTIWNEHVERWVGDLAMELIVSIDAIEPATLERIRVGTDAERLWRNVDRFAAITAVTGAPLTLCMCLMADNWRELGPFLREVDRRGLHPRVIWVDGPARFNVLTMPTAELEQAVRTLSDDVGMRATLSPDALAIWDDAVERLSEALDARRRAEVAVHVGTAPAPTAVDLRGEQRKELSSVTPHALVELELVNDVVVDVVAPEWAAWLGPDDWVGTGLEQIMTVIAAAAGVTMRYEVESAEHGVHRAVLTFGTDGGPTTVRATLVPSPDTVGSSSLFMALLDP